MRIETRRPRMTAGRAALIGLLQRYTGPGMGVTPIELQKLMYLLQSAGEPLSLNYAHGHYGPYAENLNHVLQAIEGHFVRGYGDRSRAAPDAEPLELVPGAAEEAGEVLAGRPDSRRRFDRVLKLIEGFESAYGLELLATVHWIVTHEDQRAAEDVGAVVTQVQSWSGRKRRLFGERHITLAWSQLRLQGWFAGSGTA